MQAQQPENPDDVEFGAFFAGPAFELLVSSDVSVSSTVPGDDAETRPAPRRQLLLPVSASIVVHLCLFVLLRQLVSGVDQVSNNIELQAPSIQISFRPRPTAVPEPAPAAETDADVVPEPLSATEQEPPSLPRPAEDALLAADASAPANEASPLQEPASPDNNTAPDNTPPQAPRLAAPALLDVRDLVRSRAQQDTTSRIYNTMDCDERQRRSDLIACGDEDPNNQYNFAAAEQNPTVVFFEGLNLPPEDTSNQTPDRTSGAARTSASQQNMTGNLGANPLIRSVMGQQ